MSGTSTARPGKALIPSRRDRHALRKRVGAFLRARRQELGLTQSDITRALNYVSLNSVSNLETGREGLPAKRIYAWAEILQVPRDPFFRFVTGEAEKMEMAERSASVETGRLTPVESELITAYRRLPPKFQRRLREHAQELEVLARASRRRRGT